MCQQTNAEETTRLWIELGQQRRDVRVSDEAGRLLMEVRRGALTCWAADAPPGSRQRDLLEFLGQAAVYDEQQADAAPDYPMPKNRRRKLWEMRGSYHCPVIGTCTSVSELRKLARQAHMESQVRLTDYEVHSSFVAMAAEHSHASKRLQKHLDKKYQQTLRCFSACDDEKTLRKQWLESRGNGDIAGPFWAVMTHPATTTELAQEVYQELHMLSHRVAAQRSSDVGRVKELQVENRRLERELQRNAVKSAESLAAKSRQIERLTTRIARAREAELQLEQLQNGETVQKMAERIDQLERIVAQTTRRAEQAERLYRRRLDESAPTSRERAPFAALNSTDNCTECCENAACPRVDLGGRCILCVGGLTGTTDRYRELVEECNGHFLHHDGGKEDNSLQLNPLLQRADAIVCPVDCVSHDAARRVKRYCKRYGKTFIFLRSSSSNAFAGALDKLSCN